MSYYRWNPYTSQKGEQHRVSVSAPSTPDSSSRSSGRSHRSTSPVRSQRPLDAYDAESDSSSSGNTATTARSNRSSTPPCPLEHPRPLAPSATTGPAVTRTQPINVEAEQSQPGDSALSRRSDAHAAGRALIQRFRILPSDSAIEEAVRLASDDEKQQLLDTFQADPDVVPELCLSYRGNVLCHTLSLLPARGAAIGRILAPLVPLFPEMLQHQHGTIALIRLFDHADAGFVRTLCAQTIGNFTTLAVHPFGNFVVSRVLEALTRDQGAEALLSTAEAYVEDPIVLKALATNKFGSHVLETWIRVCSEDALLRTAGAIVTNPPLVAALGFHPVGNFPLQAVLRRLARSFPQGHRYAAEVANVPALVADSRFQLNIRKAVYGMDPRQKDQSGSPRNASRGAPM